MSTITMSTIKLCDFCDIRSCPDHNIEDGIPICSTCQPRLATDLVNQEVGECPVCLDEINLVKLPTCEHKLCIKCCKTIYFGSTTVDRPLHHWLELEIPEWPESLSDVKNEEYLIFDNEHYDCNQYTYESLITIRDNLISQRPAWMNTEEFINYENACFRCSTECIKLVKLWEDYEKSKTKGNSCCPLCRAKNYII
jgi:hypothetical protein